MNLSGDSQIVSNLRQTQFFANQLAKDITPGTVIALYGELGVGKTTFVQYLAHSLGISKRITSPTFTLIKPYKLNSPSYFYHLDLYRTQSQVDVQGLGLEELISENKHIFAIEWPQNSLKLLPKSTIHLHFQHLENSQRKITIKKH